MEDCKGLEDGKPCDAGEMRCGDILCEPVLEPGPSFLKLPDKLPDTLSDASRPWLLGLAGEITSNKSDKGSFCKDSLNNELWLLVCWLLDVFFDLSFFFLLPFNVFFFSGLSPPFPFTTEKRFANASWGFLSFRFLTLLTSEM